jgi:hypothetical protein
MYIAFAAVFSKFCGDFSKFQKNQLAPKIYWRFETAAKSPVTSSFFFFW